jgi:ribosomal protein S18 acetylase RimI-like enzyme
MRTLVVEGCREVTLTVTDENRQAIELYERVGFRTLTSFDAYVWGE